MQRNVSNPWDLIGLLTREGCFPRPTLPSSLLARPSRAGVEPAPHGMFTKRPSAVHRRSVVGFAHWLEPLPAAHSMHCSRCVLQPPPQVSMV